MPRGRRAQDVFVRLSLVVYVFGRSRMHRSQGSAVLSALLSIFLKVTYSELRSIYSIQQYVGTRTSVSASEDTGGVRTELLVPGDVPSQSDDSDQRCPSCRFIP
jgi:hypothetical protein